MNAKAAAARQASNCARTSPSMRSSRQAVRAIWRKAASQMAVGFSFATGRLSGCLGA